MNAQRTLRIAGVPEAFNDPFSRIDPNVAQLVPHPGGSGAMLTSLVSGEVDAAFVLTEAVVSAIARGNANVGIVAPVVASSLVWGVVAKSGWKSDGKFEGQWAVSRHGSGSDVMLKVWARENAPPVKVCGNFDSMCDEVIAGNATAFLWEKSTTRGLLRKKGEERLAIVDQVVAPWPAFCCIARKGYSAIPDIRSFVTQFVTSAEQWKLDPGTSSMIAKKYGMSDEEATEWLNNVQFAKPNDCVDHQGLSNTMESLLQAGALKGAVDISQFLINDT